jgi:tRNA-splicing ligase RtcB
VGLCIDSACCNSYKIYGRDLIEDATIDQFKEALEWEHSVVGALMADGHLGYTMPIGGVIATEDLMGRI